MGTKRGGAVLEAPPESYAPNWQPNVLQDGEWPVDSPAPAGAHQRASAGAFAHDPVAGSADREEPYVPQRGSFRFRLRGGVPRSVAGRIALGAACLGTLGLLALTAAAARHFLLHDPLFLVTTSADIEIVGNQHLTRAQVLSVFGADLERNIFKVPLEQRRTDLERLPWVADATVMRLLPNQLRVSLTERTPVAFVRQGSRIGLVDGAGVLLDMPAEDAGDPHYSFPVLTGLSPDDTAAARAARMEVYHRFMTELDGSGEKLTQGLSEVDVANPEDLKAVVTSGASDILVHFGDENFLGRFQAFEQHLPEWKTQYPKLASADMRYERQVVLEMQAGAAIPLTNEAVAPHDALSQTTLPGTKPAAKVGAHPGAKGLKPVPPLSAQAARIPEKTPGGNARMFAALAAAHQADVVHGADAAHKTAGRQRTQ